MSDLASELHPDLRDLVGKTIADRYRIDSILGVGGMAVVFRSHHLGLKRDVAVKVLHPSFISNDEISARFEREAESASRLDHPNCVQVTDFGKTDQGMMFMVMQLLEGGELTEHLTQPMDPLRCVEMVIQVARGLDHAHKQGVVHRDIKPENIFITTDHAGREVLKLVDFGISKIVGGSTEGHKTSAGLVFGTPAYMSPEQAAGVEADARADLYSVGIIMYQMLAGKLPFESDDPIALVRMQVGRDPDPLPGHVPPVLAGVVERLLMKDRDERFSSATELIVTLESVWPLLGGIPHALAWPSSTGPIDLSGSGAILLGDNTGSISLSTITGERELITGPRRLMQRLPQPVAPPQSNRHWLYIGGGVVAALAVFGAVGLSVLNDGARADDSGAVAKAESVGDDAADVEPDDSEDIRVGVDALTLAQLDKLVLAGKLDDADKLLSPLRDEYPEDPELLWRQGRILAKRKRRDSQALSAYGEAMEKDPALLENKDFYAELYDLMERRRVRGEALDLALQKMGSQGHKFLLQVVNDGKRPLAYHDRQRALTELSKDPVNITLINSQLNMALDLLQSKDSLTPCKSYGDALEAIAAQPDYWFHNRVDKVSVPTVEQVEVKQEEASACDGLAERRDEVLAMLAALQPETDEPEGGPGETSAQAGSQKQDKVVPASTAAAPAGRNSPSGGSSRTARNKKKIDCSKRFARLKKECRK